MSETQQSTLLRMPTEVLLNIASFSDDDSLQALRCTGKRTRIVAEELLQRYLTIDCDVTGVYASLPWDCLKKDVIIKELTINTVPSQLDSSEFLTQKEYYRYARGNDSPQVDTETFILDALQGFRIAKCRILHQTEGLHFTSIFGDSKLAKGLPAKMILQATTTRERSIGTSVITIKAEGVDDVCYAGQSEDTQSLSLVDAQTGLEPIKNYMSISSDKKVEQSIAGEFLANYIATRRETRFEARDRERDEMTKENLARAGYGINMDSYWG